MTLFGNRVDTVAVQDDGRILAAGDFELSSLSRENVIRLLPDGRRDPTFDPSRVTYVNDIEVLEDGRVLLAGTFRNAQGGRRQGLAMLFPDGRLDPSFKDPEIEGSVNSVVDLGDGRILIGGDFYTVNNLNHHGVARLDLTGELDPTFSDPEFGVERLDDLRGVREVAVDEEGRVVAVGDFATVAGESHPSIVRLLDTGAIDPTFVPAVVSSSAGVEDLALQEDGRIVISGDFASVGGSSRADVARLLEDGALDTSFTNPAVSAGPPSNPARVEDVALQGDGGIVIGGDFRLVGGELRRNAARLLPNGELDATLANPLVDAPVLGVAVAPDAKIVLGGSFTHVETRSWTFIARLRAVSIPPSGVLDPSFGGDGVVQSALVPSVFATDVAIQPDGRIVSAGSASGIGGRIAVMRHDPKGELDPTFGGDGGVETNVTAANDWAEGVAVQLDGKIVVAGHAGSGSSGAMVVVRYLADGTLDRTFSGDGKATVDFGPGTEIAYDLAVQPDGRIVVAGIVGGKGGQFGLARLRRNGTLDPTFSGDGRTVTDFTRGQDWAYAIGIASDGRIFAAGGSLGTLPRIALARYRSDGSLDTAFGDRGRVSATFGGRLAIATSLVLQSDGRLVVGGVGSSGTSPAFGVARFLRSGAADPSFAGDGRTLVDVVDDAEDDVYDVVVQSDGAIVLAGVSAVGGGAFAAARVRENGVLDTDFGVNGTFIQDLTPGADIAFAAALQADGKLVLAGGSGTSVAQVTLARYVT
ncbi:MAG: hypothetical protein JNK12_19465 [Acidimicrobiales bacterium]|nr:hypothetical protein [Acidimicrobiales bacterium]